MNNKSKITKITNKNKTNHHPLNKNTQIKKSPTQFNNKFPIANNHNPNKKTAENNQTTSATLNPKPTSTQFVSNLMMMMMNMIVMTTISTGLRKKYIGCKKMFRIS
jgi:hypothetical protein